MIDPKDIPDSAVEAAVRAYVACQGNSSEIFRDTIAAALNDMLVGPVGYAVEGLKDGWQYEVTTYREDASDVPLYAIKQGASRE